MSDFMHRFQKIMNDIEENISNPQDFKYVRDKIAEISALNMEIMDNMVDIIASRLETLENNQKSMERKIDKIQASVSGIESDIYDESYDFEITCPYCNTIFTADIQKKQDIKCPECQNVIELDWNSDDLTNDNLTNNCPGGKCSGCGACCGGSRSKDYEEDVDEYEEIENADTIDSIMNSDDIDSDNVSVDNGYDDSFLYDDDDDDM